MFITFEGIEGCGKSTQVRRLAERLKGFSIPLIVTHEPGATRIGNDIRKILLDSRNKDLYPLAELFLYEADRAQHVEEVVKPALRDGKWVICDRFYDATLAYQGFARGQEKVWVKNLNEKASGGIRPDITFLLDCPVEVGLKRALKRNADLKLEGQERFERERLSFHHEVRKGYLNLAEEDRDRFFIVDGTLTEQKLEDEIFCFLKPHIKRSKRL